MEEKGINIHSLLISVLMSLMAFLIVNIFLIDIKLFHFISIEIVLGITAGISIFVKKKLGIK